MQPCPNVTPYGRFCTLRYPDEEILVFSLFFLRCRHSLFLRYVVMVVSTFAQYDKSSPKYWGLCFAKYSLYQI